MIFFVFLKPKFSSGLTFVSLDLTGQITFDPVKGFRNIITLPAFDRVSYWTDKIVLRITFSFYQHYFEIMGRGASYMIPG